MRNTLSLFFLVFFGLMLFCACDQIDPEKPKVRFEKPFDQRRVNMKRVLHERFRFEGDTNIYLVKFERRTKMNNLINLSTGDTVFRGFVSNNDDLWVVSEPVDDLGYLVWGFRTKDDFVYAWGTRLVQHQSLSTPLAAEGVLDVASGVILAPTKEEQILSTLRKDLLPAYQKGMRFERLSRADVRQALKDDDDDEDDADPSNESFMQDEEVSVMNSEVKKTVAKVYPQPAKTALTLEMVNSGDYVIKCFDMSGTHFQDFEKTGSILSLNVSDWENGNYILAIFNADGLLLDQKKVVIGR